MIVMHMYMYNNALEEITCVCLRTVATAKVRTEVEVARKRQEVPTRSSLLVSLTICLSLLLSPPPSHKHTLSHYLNLPLSPLSLSLSLSPPSPFLCSSASSHPSPSFLFSLFSSITNLSTVYLIHCLCYDQHIHVPHQL